MLTRTLVLCPPEEVNPMSVGDFLQDFFVMDSFKGAINIALCSDGGWTQGGFAIHDAIVHANNKVIITGLGAISSIAVFIFQAGVERIISPSSSMFLHEMQMHCEGPITMMHRANQEGARLQKVYNETIAARTGGILTAKDVNDMCHKETLLTPEQALELGLADQILGQPKPKKKAKKK